MYHFFTETTKKASNQPNSDQDSLVKKALVPEKPSDAIHYYKAFLGDEEQLINETTDAMDAKEDQYSSITKALNLKKPSDAIHHYKTNFDHALRRYQFEWEKALQLMNFYDLNQNAPNGPTTKSAIADNNL